MASSRHLKGSVLSRVRDLLKSGVMKEKPVWFDVMAAFPPLAEADLDRQAEPGRVKSIVYPEDAIRRKYFSSFEQEAISLWELSDKKTTSDRFVEECLELIEKGSSEAEAFDEAVRSFQNELSVKKTPTSPSKRLTHKAKGSSRTVYDLLEIKQSDSIEHTE